MRQVKNCRDVSWLKRQLVKPQYVDGNERREIKCVMRG